MKVALIGPFPPPFGGVSVHLQRLRAGLESRGVEVEVLTGTEHIARGTHSRLRAAGKARWFAEQLGGGRCDVIHFHGVASQLPRVRPLALLAAAGRPIVATLHSFRPREAPGRSAVLTRLALRRLDHVICIGEDVRTEVLSWGVAPERATVLSPYLPPDLTAPAPLPASVERFLARHHPVLTANASKLLRVAGHDIYGLDTCVELLHALADEYPGLGFLFVVAQVGDEGYRRSIERRIDELGLSERFMLLRSTGEYWPILRRATAFLRPTTTDSFGISVAEALDLGVPAIASDVCGRAPGALLFRTGDLDDALRQVRRVLAGEAQPAAPDRPRQGAAGVEPVLDIYRRVIRARPSPQAHGSAGGAPRRSGRASDRGAAHP